MKMKALRKLVSEKGIDTEGLVLGGERAMRFSGETTNLGMVVDEWVPVLASLSLRRNGVVLAEIEPSSPAFAELSQTLDDIVALPLYRRLDQPGGQGWEKSASFEIAYAKLDALYRAEEDAWDAILRKDEAALDEIAWTRFQWSDRFRDHSWDRDTFLGLRRDYREGPYFAGMQLSDYCNWFARSSSRIDESGELTVEARMRAHELLDAWAADRDAESLCYWLTRNLEVHPRHRAPYEALVNERLGRSAPGPR